MTGLDVGEVQDMLSITEEAVHNKYIKILKTRQGSDKGWALLNRTGPNWQAN